MIFGEQKYALTENTGIDYNYWFLQPKWDFKQAALLLCDICPNDKFQDYKWCDGFYIDQFIPICTTGCYNIDVYTKSDFINEVLENYSHRYEVNNKSLEKPLDWIKWFVDEGILKSVAIWGYLKKNNIDITPTNNSKIYQYYTKWAYKEAWAFDDVVALLCRRATYESYDLMKCALPHDCYSTKEIISELKQSIMNKAIDYIEVDCHSHIERRFKPDDIIKWAEIRNYKFPTLLMQIMGYEKLMPNPKNKRGCKTEILKEFDRRAKENLLHSKWDDELTYLRQYAGNIGETYTIEAIKNIIPKKMFLGKRL